ncbi:MAG: hypothetical protein ACLUD2_07725 [Clostridium sp.]
MYRVENEEGSLLILSKVKKMGQKDPAGSQTGAAIAQMKQSGLTRNSRYLFDSWVSGGADGRYTELDALSTWDPAGYAEGGLKALTGSGICRMGFTGWQNSRARHITPPSSRCRSCMNGSRKSVSCG